MAKLKNPLASLSAVGRLGQNLTFLRRRKQNIAEKTPIPDDPQSLAQLSWRHMFLKVVALWHSLTPSEQQEWESTARRHHLTGYQWFISQALRPNPGIYLPLQGGTMSGGVDMAKNPIEKLPAPLDDQDADTQGARDAAIAAALEDCIDSHIHGWDGSDWQKLLVESNVLHNLRVKLYDGANEVTTGLFNTVDLIPADVRGLDVRGQLYLFRAPTVSHAWYTASAEIDNSGGYHMAPVALWGFDGSNFDRLRTYGIGILKVGRAEIGLSDARLIAQGQVKASPGNLYWMLLNPSAGNSLVELTDSLAAGAAVKIDHFDTTRDGHMITFDPPAEFTTGIFLQTITNITSIIFGYV